MASSASAFFKSAKTLARNVFTRLTYEGATKEGLFSVCVVQYWFELVSESFGESVTAIARRLSMSGTSFCTAMVVPGCILEPSFIDRLPLRINRIFLLRAFTCSMNCGSSTCHTGGCVCERKRMLERACPRATECACAPVSTAATCAWLEIHRRCE